MQRGLTLVELREPRPGARLGHAVASVGRGSELEERRPALRLDHGDAAVDPAQLGGGGRPRPGQKRALRGGFVPQPGQGSAAAADALIPGFCPGFERS